MAGAFDILVVGSGSGGAPVARRLADAGARVAVIEAGSDPLGDPVVADPAQWFALQSGRWDWGHAYRPAAALNGRVVPIPRGKALGGSSVTNAMMWYRGVPDDYARWNAVAPGWSWADCLPAFLASESWDGGGQRGTNGPLQITRASADHPLTQAMLAGGAAMGLPVIDDPNGPEPEGVALANFNIDKTGLRHSSADAYLRPVIGKGVTLLTRTRALSVLFDGDRAVGLRVADAEGTRDLFADRIVLAAGALETPRLLMLSGIGAKDDLQRLGIKTRIDAPEVGRNLQDHPLLRALNIRPKRPLGPPVGNGGGTLTIWRSDPSLPQADLLAFPIQNASGGPDLRARYDLSGEAFAIGVGVMRSYSRGWMRLTGTDPDDPLEIEPNLLSDPRDLTALTTGVLHLQEMLEGPAFADLFAGHLAPDSRVDRAGAEAFVRLACSTFFHCTGTARMGADAQAVVTPRLQVNGLHNLWIADASVIPEIPACHTHAPVTMIGERAARFIQEDA
ncbi:GMC family oxidoreductase [Rhodobacter sp. NTK016B]|uniref:GMC family oxidoreductase n=1 Tax=Rhodobacter sp. NTK016B TaxID=2759676 RepID=UPI001A90011A|nr:GMC family oxidoreductase [Rhodobacter sp. NTK016B]MBN8293677.1 GMC family oxidoreductase [Rhodobacter sp. NTK016B]